MTFLEIYNEILKRSGEGYDAYLDRAEEMFWKAVSTIIRSGEYTDTEIRNLSRRYTKELSKDDFINNGYNIYKIWSSSVSPNPLLSPLYLNEVFDYVVEITPIIPESMKYHQVSVDELRTRREMSKLCEDFGFPEVLYAWDHPDIYISSNAPSFRGLMVLKTHSIPRATKNDSSTNADAYMNYGFVIRAIEMAVGLLKTETE